MKKSIIIFILFMVWGAAMSLPLNHETDQRVSATEIGKRIQNQQTPLEDQVLQGMIFNYLHQQYLGLKSGQMPMQTMTEVLHRVWNGASWENSELEQQYLNANGWVTEMYAFTWENNTWENMMHTIITYNANGLPITMLMKMWDGAAWMDVVQMTITYTTFNYPLEMIMQFNMGGGWMNAMKEVYTYNAQEQCLNILQQSWDLMSSAWVDESKDSFTYDANGWMIEELSQLWEGNAWVNEEIAYSTYDGSGHETEKLVKVWISNAWENNNHFIYAYNAQWLLSQETCEYWYNNTWNNNYLYTYQYDAQERMIEELFQIWESEKGWVNDAISTWTYDLSIGIAENLSAVTECRVYPNPAEDFATIGYSLGYSASVSVCIYDLTGRPVLRTESLYQDKGAYTSRLDVTKLPAGMYFISLEGNGITIATQRLLVNR